MARFIITVVLPTTPVTYLYEDAKKALAKARTLQRTAARFTVTDSEGEPLTIADLEQKTTRT